MKLANVPMTNVLAVNGIALTWATFLAWAVLKLSLPDGWLTFVIAVGVTAAAQFVGKRATWKPESPQNEPTP